jgi:hypothetical protein
MNILDDVEGLANPEPVVQNNFELIDALLPLESIPLADEFPSAGTDATFTGSMAQLSFGTTQPAAILPTAGQYLIRALIHVHSPNAAIIGLKLRNTTDGVDITPEYDFEYSSSAGDHQNIPLHALITIDAPKEIQIWGQMTSGSGVLAAAIQTRIDYLRVTLPQPGS